MRDSAIRANVHFVNNKNFHKKISSQPKRNEEISNPTIFSFSQFPTVCVPDE
jgi:hypothetical protein